MNYVLKTIKSYHYSDWFVFLVLFIGFIISASQGYINADSWLYLHLAQSISMGNGLTLNEGYFAVFPFGYSLLISIFSFFSTDINHLIIASKITNLILAIISYTYAKKIFKSNLFAAFFVINPIYLTTFAWTISENLFYPSIMGAFYYSIKIAKCFCKKDLFKLFICIIFIISARYFSGTFLFSFFIIYIIVFGFKNFWLKITPFVLGAIFFLTYQFINKEITGYATGMPRIPAPESVSLIASSFFSNLSSIILLLLGFYILILITFKTKIQKKEILLTISSTATKQNIQFERKIALFLGLSGLAYLLNHLILRSLYQYNDLDIRLLGFGCLLLFSGISLYFIKLKNSFNLAIMLLFSILSFDTSNVQRIKSFKLITFEHPLKDKYSTYISFITVHSPHINKGIIHNQSRHDIYTMDRDEYYGYDKKVIFIKSGPYVVPDTLQDIKNKLKDIDLDQCAIDFTIFDTEEDLKKSIDTQTKIDRNPNVFKNNMDEQVLKKILEIYKPNSLVPCHKIL